MSRNIFRFLQANFLLKEFSLKIHLTHLAQNQPALFIQKCVSLITRLATSLLFSTDSVVLLHFPSLCN